MTKRADTQTFPMCLSIAVLWNRIQNSTSASEKGGDMPALIAARFVRIIPLLIIFAVLAILIYVIISWRYTTNHAKEALIKVFTVLTIATSVLFLLATIYALIENNAFVAEFFVTCLATTLILLGITLLCKRSFRKHHPNFRWEITERAKTTK